MLTLQRKIVQSLPKTYRFLGLCCGISSALHIFIALAVYCTSQPDAISLVMNVRIPDNVTIVMQPGVKKVQGSLQKVMQQAQANAGKVQQKIVTTTAAVKNAKKDSGGTIIAAAPAKKQKIAQKKSVKKTAVVAKTSSKKVVEKKVKPLEEKKVIAQPEPKKPEPIKVTEVESQEKSSEKITETLIANLPETELIQDVIYVGQHDMEVIQMYKRLQESLEESWQVPVGLSPDLYCTLQVTVNPQGTVNDIATVESSGVVSFDIAARCALETLAFDNVTWGKQLTITFKQ